MAAGNVENTHPEKENWKAPELEKFDIMAVTQLFANSYPSDGTNISS